MAEITSQSMLDAIASGNTEFISSYISSGGNVNAKIAVGTSSEGASNAEEETLIQCAARLNQLAVLQCLFANGANMHEKTLSSGQTPLHLAAAAGNVSIVQFILQNLEEKDEVVSRHNLFSHRLEYINAIDSRARTPLFLATVRQGGDDDSLAIVEALLDAGADVHMSPFSCSSFSKSGGTPLFEAADRGHESIAIALIRSGADVNAFNVETGDTPLFCAARGYITLLEALLAANADVDAEGCRSIGWSPLDVAAAEDEVEAVALLLQHGASVSLSYLHGSKAVPTSSAALILAMEHGASRAMQLLADNGADTAECPMMV